MANKQHNPPKIKYELIQLPCEECCKKIPYSREAEDYVVYFCGLDCYQKWEQKTHGTETHVPREEVFIQDHEKGELT